ncbi:GDP-mannose 4,6-dehydratase [Flagellimonas zhangzhouensis]|uniref:UDP-glucose 4-epimerase n=1 Tax=Flagellimonas zhangzhouensis TaxID=1073328 RepID=A0A1H2UQK8_9FLAO|nr:GDP-mannose 4,6-dehydratase [Allomuricauda zhangzhouensis]SDQ14739.1 UDP-glucose 4-epimerase [Allomuricauda zhangzhouensis]SDW58407.1 UDP-glucose 4-epimerase [Allomuricauda zhangzhouensis]
MESPISRTVLITGVTGFTGKHLETELSENGFQVFGTTYSKPLQENHFECNILDLDQLAKVIAKTSPDYVIHLAAISFVATKDIPKIYATNVQGTLNLMEALLGANKPIKKVLVASSAAVYGNIGTVLSEDMCPKPVNHYGNSKLAMENMVANYFDKLNIIIARPFNYTGIGQEDHFLIPKIIKHYKEKKDVIELGNLDTYREYNDVRFLVSCYRKLLLIDDKSDTVNIASGSTFSINDILTIMTDLSSHKIQVKVNSQFVRKNEVKELKGSSNKLIQLIGSVNDSTNSLPNTLEEMYLS